MSPFSTATFRIEKSASRRLEAAIEKAWHLACQLLPGLLSRTVACPFTSKAQGANPDPCF